MSAAWISVVGLTRLSYTSAVDQGKCVPAIGSVYNVYVALSSRDLNLAKDDGIIC